YDRRAPPSPKLHLDITASSRLLGAYRLKSFDITLTEALPDERRIQRCPRLLRSNRRSCLQEDLSVPAGHGEARDMNRSGHWRRQERLGPRAVAGQSARQPRKAWRTG